MRTQTWSVGSKLARHSSTTRTTRCANRRKDEFLAILAHELRNPLAPLRTGIDLLKYAQDDPQAIDETRETMEQQLELMVRLIDDLMEISRLTLIGLLIGYLGGKLAVVVGRPPRDGIAAPPSV
ncbi:MAG TPA: histidine kinase dimerization/phospho-acceptor domain-containing protein [Pirellulaceae bacterium]|jgi:signal transduction histidine kinase|nr:histidine kinase dimerization/phospho-acceptor domain-containing protein [Pirellulaceae bacterium]